MINRHSITYWLLFLFLLGLLTKNLIFLYGLLVLTGIILLSWVWNHFCFSKLTVKRSLSRNRVFCGEECQYIIEIENRKLIPMLWLRINDSVTTGINFDNPKMLRNMIGTRYNIFSDVFSLKWYERVVRKYNIKPIKRGYFLFGKGELRAVDLFGFNTQILKDGKNSVHLLVYPRVVPLERLGLPKVDPFGKSRSKDWIYLDPTNQVGVRPYKHGDRFNQINWKATARLQSLQSNDIKPTLDTKLLIVLNTRLVVNSWEGFSLDTFELAVICAASIANHTLDKGYQVGLMTNGVIYEKSLNVKVFPGKSTQQKEKILEALAMIEPFHRNEIDEMIYLEIPKYGIGTSVVVITVILDQKLVKCLKVLKKKGYNPTVIKIGQDTAEYLEQLSCVPIYLVDEEGLGNEMETLHLVRKPLG